MGEIPKNVKQHADILCFLARAKPKLAKMIIAEADPSLLNAISQCSLNILKGVIPLTKRQQLKLRRYKEAMRCVSCSTTTKQNAKRKKALLSRGGFLSALLSAVVPMLLSSVGGLLFNRKRKSKK